MLWSDLIFSCLFSNSQEKTLLFQAHVLPSHGNYLVMPYMPPSKASCPLPRLLFAAIAQAGVGGPPDIDVEAE